jgi:hypothetical protein
MLDWIQPENYQFTHSLSPEEWAWEFLRRNRSYRKEWQEFMTVWHALEADYGKPPNRDFCAWKLDRRAWVPAAECTESDCRVDEDKVLIECALGARWGFHKFPPDPGDDKAVSANRLAWRERPGTDEVVELSLENEDYLGKEPHKVALGFDLSLPLREQIEQAKRHLQLLQKQRVRQELFKLKSLKNLRDQLTLCLRIIDAQDKDVSENQLQQAFGDIDVTALISQSRYYLDKGYLELLRIPG